MCPREKKILEWVLVLHRQSPIIFSFSIKTENTRDASDRCVNTSTWFTSEFWRDLLIYTVDTDEHPCVGQKIITISCLDQPRKVKRTNSSVVPRDEDKAAERRRRRFFTYRCWSARLRMHLVLVNCSSSPGQWRHVRRCSAPIWWRPAHQPRSIWICLRRSARGFLVKAWRKQTGEFQLLIAKSVKRQRDDGWKRRVLWEVLSIHECLISEQLREEKTLFTKHRRVWVFSFGWKKPATLVVSWGLRRRTLD